MFGRCDLCGGPGTTAHYCPAMVRNCRLCGGHGLADLTHMCPGLSRACPQCHAPGGADYTHVCPPVGTPPTFTYPQVVYVIPQFVYPQVIETGYRVTCEAA